MASLQLLLGALALLIAPVTSQVLAPSSNSPTLNTSAIDTALQAALLGSAPTPLPAGNPPASAALNASAITAALQAALLANASTPPVSSTTNIAALNASANAALQAALLQRALAPAPTPVYGSFSNLTLQQILNNIKRAPPAVLGVGALGVTYGGQQAQPLPFPQVVSLLLRNNITAIRFLDPPDADNLEALAHTGIQVSIMVPNNYIVYLSNNPDAARSWVNTWVGSYIDRVDFKYVVVGDTPLRLVFNCYYCTALPLAVTNIQAALLELGLTTQVSVPLDANDVLDPSNGAWPPNKAAFDSTLAPALLLLLKTAFESNANILVEFNPYAIMQANTSIPLNMALGTAQIGDPGTFQIITGANYTNLYDIYLDAIANAATLFQYPTLNITISSTGWPTDGGPNASLANAQAYVDFAIRRALSTGGTPAKPSQVVNIYLNEIIDEDMIELQTIPFPNDWQRHMGLFTPQGGPKFPVNVRGTNDPPQYLNGLQDLIRLPTRFCVAKPGVPDTALLIAQIDACSNGADCTPFSNGGSCFEPDTTRAHTSYAFNDYYQKHAQWSAACDFNGTAYLVLEDPSYGNCTYSNGVGLPGYGVPGTVRDSGAERREVLHWTLGLACLALLALGVI